MVRNNIDQDTQEAFETEDLTPQGVSRRQFLRDAAVTVGAGVIGKGMIKPAHAETGVRWGMIVDLRKCVGCKSCTVACKVENHTPPGVAYCIVMEEEVGTYPSVRRKFTYRPCMQCSNSSCTKVCPVGATYTRDDGIVVIDYDQCIGCRYCIAACPYGARSFDYGHEYHKDANVYETQPSPEYGENRVREHEQSPIGNVRKCTWCLHRVKKGLGPACAETCIGRAIHFGNVADPDGRCLLHGEHLNELMVTRNHIQLKEESGNNPSVYYLM